MPVVVELAGDDGADSGDGDLDADPEVPESERRMS
jgi:hypothetical protein